MYCRGGAAMLMPRLLLPAGAGNAGDAQPGHEDEGGDAGQVRLVMLHLCAVQLLCQPWPQEEAHVFGVVHVGLSGLLYLSQYAITGGHLCKSQGPECLSPAPDNPAAPRFAMQMV